jgi:hypothetical protein
MSAAEQTHDAPMHDISSMRNIAPPSTNQELSLSPSDPQDCNTATMPLEQANSEADVVIGAPLPRSPFPNSALAHFLELIKASAFIEFNELEPSINSEAGQAQALLRAVSNHDGCPPIPDRDSNHSVYLLMVDRLTKKCLMCGKPKSSLQRAITCIRVHLNHRPFFCGGDSSGCLTCGKKSR